MLTILQVLALTATLAWFPCYSKAMFLVSKSWKMRPRTDILYLPSRVPVSSPWETCLSNGGTTSTSPMCTELSTVQVITAFHSTTTVNLVSSTSASSKAVRGVKRRNTLQFAFRITWCRSVRIFMAGLVSTRARLLILSKWARKEVDCLHEWFSWRNVLQDLVA